MMRPSRGNRKNHLTGGGDTLYAAVTLAKDGVYCAKRGPGLIPHGGGSRATGVKPFKKFGLPIRRQFFLKRLSQPKLGLRKALLFLSLK